MNWHKYLVYLDGDLFWKKRCRSEFKSDKSWRSTNTCHAGKIAGAKVTGPRSVTEYRQFELFGRAYKCHRVVWEMHNGEIPSGLIVDHIDGNGMNNKIENLRLVNSIDSMHNKPMQKNCISGVMGVCWHKPAKKWQARINHKKQRIDLGRFDSFEEAVKARKAAEVLYGYHKNHGRGHAST